MYMYYHDDYEYIRYCEIQAHRMYPKIYHELMPHIKRVCEMEDSPNNPMMEPFPNEEKIEKMVEKVYKNYKNGYRDENDESIDEFFRDRHHGIRDIITILLLGELLGRRRRRRRRRRRFFHGYGHPGFFY
ncbi:hypothetical protein SAMN02745883_01080 [Caminicella sporogenes DSM 14501]|uniref:Uncharacterized protein n=1 Tax=Caminicella sporogenes DSM 14501 TaxID=1121266 RepID=A0A1M6P2K1_9FIRM|nr:hypothetical protein [Caminicella sporogenes]RKD21552.1 hypothetical protein BET04_07445 [Caminicella sporogenes]SHK02195.1 hypothetical protein SAMN02745883_01080 [Caminicella sporogenes DSM 14501]